MQNEDKNTGDLDDDFLDDEDDFDFGDLDDSAAVGDLDDDLGDDSWDDFDDIPDAEIKENISSGAPEDSKPPATQKPTKKSFVVSKNFKFIIIAIAALGGGGLFLSQMTDTATKTTAPATITEDIMAEMPTATALPSALPDTGTDGGGQPIEDDIFKGPEELAEQTEEQPQESITIDIGEAPPMPAPMSSPPQAAIPTSAPSNNEILTPMPEMASLSEQEHLVSLDEPLEEQEESPTISELPKEETEAAPEPEPEMLVADTSQPPAPPLLLETTTPEPAAAEPKANITAGLSQENETRFEKMDQEIKALEKKLANANDKLARQLSETDNKISKLTDTIARLEENITAMNKPTSAPPMENKPAVQEKAASVAQPTVKPKKSPSPTAKNTPSGTTWQLRSAQPGKALISEEGSSDFKTVTVGDTLRGLGRIVSIDLEGGKWVVTGTQGRVSQ